MKNIEKVGEHEQGPDTPEKAVQKITEEINSLLNDYPAGIPQEVLDTRDESVPREKIRHPARVTWFTLINLMLSDLESYRKKTPYLYPKEHFG